MLRKRVITTLTFQNGVLFRTKLFRPDYRYTANFVDAWSVDEIVVLDVTRPGEGQKENFYSVLAELARRCFVPVAAGGGIRTIEDVRAMLEHGADKVVVNTGALERPDLIDEISRRYGSQCVVVSVDARRHPNGRYEVFSHFADQATGRDPAEWIGEAQSRGAGEIMITAVERDGWLQGFDLELCRQAVAAATIPVLVLGGCGNWKHMEEAFDAGADGVCTQNIYHFTEPSIRSAKAYLAKVGIPVRN